MYTIVDSPKLETIVFQHISSIRESDTGYSFK